MFVRSSVNLKFVVVILLLTLVSKTASDFHTLTLNCVKSPLSCSVTIKETNKVINVPVSKEAGVKTALLHLDIDNTNGYIDSQFLPLEKVVEATLSGKENTHEFECYKTDKHPVAVHDTTSLGQSVGTVEGSKWKIVILTCGALNTKTKAEFKACKGEVLHEVIDKFKETETNDGTTKSLFTLGMTAVSNCPGAPKADNVFMQAPGSSDLPFNIIACGPSDKDPLLKVNGKFYADSDPILSVNPSLNEGLPLLLQSSPEFYDGCTCSSVKLSGEQDNIYTNVYTAITSFAPAIKGYKFGFSTTPDNEYGDFATVIEPNALTVRRVMSM